ncbi:MAG: FAD-dependent monooxygenase, partial [Pseudomonadota bacterium]
SDITVVHRKETITIDGVGFAAIGRLKLLKLLQDCADGLGVDLEFQTEADDLKDYLESDLIIGADGVNSMVRQSTSAFDETITTLDNRFAWFGAETEFRTLTQTFIETPFGPMNAHHYCYDEGLSTFIVEMSPQTFERSRFGSLTEPYYRAQCEAFFSETLGGAKLIANNSVFRQFPELECAKWYVGNKVLVGDALHTAHFSIGSGTRLAFEDCVFLVRALKAHDFNIDVALPAYQKARQPILQKIVAGSRRSAQWYERFEDHMALEPWPFALSYIRRAGRIDADRLRKLAPRFSADAEARGLALEAGRDPGLGSSGDVEEETI